MDYAQQHAGIDVRHEYNYEMHVQTVTKGPEISSATDTLIVFVGHVKIACYVHCREVQHSTDGILRGDIQVAILIWY